MYGRSDSPCDEGSCLFDSRYAVLHMLLYTHLDLHLSSYQRTRVGSSCAKKTCHRVPASRNRAGTYLVGSSVFLGQSSHRCVSEDTHPQPLKTMTCRAKKLVSLPSSGARSNSDDASVHVCGLLVRCLRCFSWLWLPSVFEPVSALMLRSTFILWCFMPVSLSRQRNRHDSVQHAATVTEVSIFTLTGSMWSVLYLSLFAARKRSVSAQQGLPGQKQQFGVL